MRYADPARPVPGRGRPDARSGKMAGWTRTWPPPSSTRTAQAGEAGGDVGDAAAGEYALLDAGDLRRLERFGVRVLDRPAASEGGFPRRDPDAWATATPGSRPPRTDRGPGTSPCWVPTRRGPSTVAGLAFELRLAAVGPGRLLPGAGLELALDRGRSRGSKPAASRSRRHPESSGPRSRSRTASRSSTCSPTPAAATLAAARPGPGSSTSTPGGRRRPGRAATPSSTASPRRRSAGSSTTPSRSPGARPAGDAATTALILDPPSFGHGPGGRPGGSRPTCPSSSRRRAAAWPTTGLRRPQRRTRPASGGPARRTARTALAEPARPRRAGGRRAGPRGARAGGRLDLGAVPAGSGEPRRARRSRARRTRGSSAAAALRDRRDRERTGRILIDGARELLRALDAGVGRRDDLRVRDRCRSAACVELLDAPRAGRSADRRIGEAALRTIAFGDRAEGVVGVAIRPPLDLGALRLPRRPADRRRRGCREAGQPRRDPPHGRRRRGRRASSPPTRGPTAPTRTRSGRASARSSASRSPRPRAPRSLAWLRARGLGSWSPGSTARMPYADVDLARPGRDRARQRGRRPDPSVGRARRRAPRACRCSARPTASTCRGRRGGPPVRGTAPARRPSGGRG